MRGWLGQILMATAAVRGFAPEPSRGQRARKQEHAGQKKRKQKSKKHATPRVPTWSPTAVLTRPEGV